MIQAVIFDKTMWTPIRARKWLDDHNYHRIKPVHTTPHFYRYRLEEPVKGAKYITKKVNPGIQLIIRV